MKVFIIDEFADASHYDGEEWWWYNGAIGAEFPAPHVIDREPPYARIIPWYNSQRGMDAYLFWATTYWGSLTNHPWNDPKLLDHTTNLTGYPNGAGYFFYPSTLISDYTPMNDISGVTTSIRWEIFIDGMEDYEYLSMASSSARSSAYTTILGIQDRSPFSKDPETYESTRIMLANDILGN